MNTKEKLYSLIDGMTEAQMQELIFIIEEKPVKKRKKASEVKGILHKYANPDLIPLEEGAWERDIIERIANGDESF